MFINIYIYKKEKIINEEKKIVISLTLALILALSLPVVAHSINNLNDDHPNVLADNGKAINVETIADIKVSVPETAVPGSKVNVKLEYDASIYNIKGVFVNSVKAAVVSSTDFYFVMPTKNVELVIEHEIVGPAFDINNVSSDIITLLGLPSKGLVGTIYDFSVGFKANSSITLKKLTAFSTLNNVDTPLDINFNVFSSKHSFTMPEGVVTIEGEFENKVFKISKTSDSASGIISTATYISETASPKTIAFGFTFLEVGNIVNVKLVSTNYFVAKGIEILETGEIILLQEGETSVSFTMPATDVTIRGIGDKIYIPFTVENSEHITLEIFAKVSSVYTPINQLEPLQTAYVKANIESDDYGVASLKATYNGSSNTTISSKPNADGYYEFTAYVSAKNYVISVTEKSFSLYKGYGFIGNYLTSNVYNSGFRVNGAKVSDVITADGTMMSGTVQRTINAVTNEDNDIARGTFTVGGAGKAYYSPTTIVYGYNFRELGPTVTDLMFGFKKTNVSDLDSDYAIDGIVNSNKSMYLVQVSYQGLVRDWIFVDVENQIYHLEGVSVEFNEGQKTIVAAGTFSVKVNDVVVATAVTTTNSVVFTKVE